MQINPYRYRSRGVTLTTDYKEVTHTRIWDKDGNLVYDEESGENGSYEYNPRYQSCSDTVGFRVRDNPFDIRLDVQKLGRMVFEFSETYPGSTWTGPAEYTFKTDVPVQVSHTIYPGDEDVSDVEFVTKAVAETNPSNAHIQGLAFAAELRDLPGLFQSVGNTMSKFGANEYLKAQYGWKPMISDLKKFFAMSDRVSRRLHAINRITKESTVRRRYRPKAEVGEAFKAVEGPVYGEVHVGSDGVWSAYGSTQMRTKRWADILWVAKPPEVLLQLPGNKQVDIARKALYGANLDGPTLWQIMPWSWLADWTYNVSDYLESQNNTVGAEFGEAILMKTTHLDTSGTPYWINVPSSGHPGGQAFLGSTVSVIKERILGIEPAVVNTGEFTSILDDGFKVSILTALGIQRLKGR